MEERKNYPRRNSKGNRDAPKRPMTGRASFAERTGDIQDGASLGSFSLDVPEEDSHRLSITGNHLSFHISPRSSTVGELQIFPNSNTSNINQSTDQLTSENGSTDDFQSIFAQVSSSHPEDGIDGIGAAVVEDDVHKFSSRRTSLDLKNTRGGTRTRSRSNSVAKDPPSALPTTHEQDVSIVIQDSNETERDGVRSLPNGRLSTIIGSSRNSESVEVLDDEEHSSSLSPPRDSDPSRSSITGYDGNRSSTIRKSEYEPPTGRASTSDRRPSTAMNSTRRKSKDALPSFKRQPSKVSSADDEIEDYLPKTKISLDSVNPALHSKQSFFRPLLEDQEQRDVNSREVNFRDVHSRDVNSRETMKLKGSDENLASKKPTPSRAKKQSTKKGSNEDLLSESHSRSSTGNRLGTKGKFNKSTDNLAFEVKAQIPIEPAVKPELPAPSSSAIQPTTKKNKLPKTTSHVSKIVRENKPTTKAAAAPLLEETSVSEDAVQPLGTDLSKNADDDRMIKPRNRLSSLTPAHPASSVTSHHAPPDLPKDADDDRSSKQRARLSSLTSAHTDDEDLRPSKPRNRISSLTPAHSPSVASSHHVPADVPKDVDDEMRPAKPRSRRLSSLSLTPAYPSSVKRSPSPSLTGAPTLSVRSSTRRASMATLAAHPPVPAKVSIESALDEAFAEEKRPSVMMAVLRAKMILTKKQNSFVIEEDESLRSSASSSRHNSAIYVQPTDNDIITRFMSLYPKLESPRRKSLLKELIRNCDPTDMKMLNETIPRFHRDFLSLCNLKSIYKILEYVAPTDLITASKVSRKWNQILNSPELWYALYDSIGLSSMAKVFYIPHGSVVDNAKLFSSTYNWAYGNFTYRSFQAHFLGVLSMSFDGKTVATGSSDKSAKVFHVKTGALLRTLKGHDGPIHSIQHDSEKVVTGSNDHTIRVWDNHGKGELLGTFVYHSRPVTCLKMRENMLVSGSEDKTVRVWDLKHLVPSHKRASVVPSYAASFNQHVPATVGDLLSVSAAANAPKIKKAKVVEVRELSDDEKCCQRTLHGHENAVKSLDVCGDVIISGDIRGIVILWHISSGNCLNIIGFHQDVQHPIQIGIDAVTDMKRQNHPPILTEPISEIQYVNNRLLVATLSGYAFVNEVKPSPQYDPDPLIDYTNFYNWAIDESTFTQKPTFSIKSHDAHVPVPPPSNTSNNPKPLGSRLSVGVGSTASVIRNSSSIAGGFSLHSASAVSSAHPKATGLCKWTLCGKSDEWRLLTGGSVGYLNVFNHRIGKFIYRLEPTTNIPTINDEQTPSVRRGSFQELVRRSSYSLDKGSIKAAGGTQTITSIDFNDSFIVGCGMDGKVHVWEPRPSVVKSATT